MYPGHTDCSRMIAMARRNPTKYCTLSESFRDTLRGSNKELPVPFKGSWTRPSIGKIHVLDTESKTGGKDEYRKPR